jgi:hypothetical protein
MIKANLRLLSGNELLLLDPTDGLEGLAEATDVFKYIDSNFHRWRFGPGPPTADTPVRIYEMVKDCTFGDMFGGLGVGLDSLALTQAQIKQFARRHSDWLKKGGNGTFFLFEIGNEFFVAAVYFFSDGRLGVRVRDFTLERVFRAQKHHRLVVKSC